MAAAKKKPKNANKKNSNILALCIVLGCTFVLAIGIVVVALFLNDTLDQEEVMAAESLIDTDRLLADVMSIDLEVSYPETPEAVMELFNNTFRLLYSPEIDDIDSLARILQVQRGLYSQALLDMNDFETQLSNLMFARGEQENLNMEIIGIYVGEVRTYRFDDSRVTIETIKFADNGQSFHYEFLLFRNPTTGYWQIGLWNNTRSQ